MGTVVRVEPITQRQLAIAKVCHEANRALCAAFGDNSQPSWDQAPQWQKDSAVAGVRFHLANPNASPSASHDSWLAHKEAEGWVPAAPADALARGPWWSLFGDPVLDQLAARVEVSNQNVAAAVGAYAQARALVREQRASLFPSVTLDGGANRSHSSSGSSSTSGSGGRTGNSFSASIGASWEPDVWGRLGRAVDSASASAQASAADLASARLSAQGELAVNYLTLRQVDAQKALLETTLTGYRRTLEHTIILGPGARGRGLGRGLMAAIEEQARAGGGHTIYAGVSAANPGGRAFHAAIGYVELAVLPEAGFKFGRWIDLVLMRKILS